MLKVETTNIIYVFGDAMVDCWLVAKAVRQSAEADIPIYDVITQVIRPGGCGNVAKALENMGVQVNRCYYNELNEIPKKTRVIIDGVQVARIDEYDSCQPYTGLPPLQNQVIVVSDYGKGAMNAEQVLKIIETRPKKIYINTKFPAPNFQCLDMEGQSSPNLPPTTWLCNFAEYKESQTFYDNQEHVYITKGQGGVEYKEFGRRKDKETSKAKKVVSVCGAGDVVLAALVVYDLPNIPVQIHSRGRLDFAMYAAGVAVSQPYTHCPTFKEIAEYTNIDTA